MELLHYEAVDIIDQLLDLGEENYSNKELEFFDNVINSNFSCLTEKQSIWLRDIYARVIE